jgi:chromosome partitioning protein
MFDERTNLAQQVTAELKRYFGAKLCETTIPRNIRLAEAPSHGKPALMYDPRSKGAESYIRLAKEIIERQQSASREQPSAEGSTTEGTVAHREDAGQEQDAAQEQDAPDDELDKSA